MAKDTKLLRLLVLVGFVACIYAGTGEETLTCPKDWVLNPTRRSCVRIFTKATTYKDSRSNCQKQGLASDLLRYDIGETEQEAFIKKFLGKSYVWVGLRQRNVNGKKKIFWLDDEKPASNAPTTTTSGGFSSQQCIFLRVPNSKLKLAPKSCSGKMYYACEQPATHVENTDCDIGWRQYTNRCFKVFNDPLPWEDAHFECLAQGAHLAVIPDRATAQWINAQDELDPLVDRKMWMGLHDLHERGDYKTGGKDLQAFHWYGRREKMNFTNFVSDNRTVSDVRLSEYDCASILSGSDHEWLNEKCTVHNPYMCEKDIDEFSCPEGWDLYFGRKMCFRQVRLLKTWDEARKDCQSMGQKADLLMVPDDPVNDYIKNTLLQYFPNAYWIGLRKAKSETRAKWTNGNTALFNKLSGDWPKEKQVCGAVQHNSPMWSGFECHSKKYYTCQQPASGTFRCPPGYSFYKKGTTCVKLSSEKAYWELARADCQRDGGDLLKVTNTALRDYVIAYTMQPLRYNVYAWIGLHDREEDKKYVWLDETNATTVTYWEHDWIATSAGDDYSNCVYMMSERGLWFYESCDTKLYYICQVDPSVDGIKQTTTTTTTSKTAPVKRCPVSWSEYSDGPGFESQCYKYMDTPAKTWAFARDACRSEGGDLATIKSKEKSQFINKILSKSKMTSLAWIGLSNKATSPNTAFSFSWLDEGTSMTTYDNWASSEPTKSKHCAVIKLDGIVIAPGRGSSTNTRTDHYSWATRDCAESKGFICQIPKSAPIDANCGNHNITGGWKYNPSQKSCYRFNEEALTGDDARWSCQIHGGQLISVLNAKQMLYLEARLRTADSPTYWIGGLKYDNGIWAWIGHYSVFPFFNWAAGEPTDYGGECMTIDRATGRWTNAKCTKKRFPSICLKKSNDWTPSVLIQPVPPSKIPKDHRWGCHPGWLSDDSPTSACYERFTTSEPVTWKEARDKCLSYGGDLASVDNNNDNYRFLYYMRDFENAWIGLNNMADKYEFRWSDGSKVTFTDWHAFKSPPGPASDDAPYCVMVQRVLDHSVYYSPSWVSKKCSEKLNNFICKQRKKLIDDRVEPDSKGQCEQNGGRGYLDKCYVYFTEKKSFAQAQKSCQKHGGNLATVTDRYVQAYLSASLSGRSHWIGLSGKRYHNPYKWQSGQLLDATRSESSSVSSGKGRIYTHWDRTHTGRESYNCVAMLGEAPVGVWHSDDCASNHSYICEYERKGYTAPPTIPAIPTTPTLQPLQCPSNWTAIGHMCYQAVQTPMTWMEAETFCQQSVTWGGSLASVTNQALSTSLIPLINTLTLPADQRVWIGLNDRDLEGGWVWAGGEAFLFAPWNNNQPNNQNNAQDCVVLTAPWSGSKNKDFRFNDANCYHAYSALCQAPKGSISLTAVSTPTAGSLSSQCGAGDWYQYSGKCYSLGVPSPDQVTWQEARDRCRAQGAHLASVEDEQENGFITSMLHKLKLSGAWIGLNDFDKDQYTWTDGSAAFYFAWSSNEPDDNYGGERCVRLDTSTGRWSDKRCSTKHHFVCKKQQGTGSKVITGPTTAKPTGGCPDKFQALPNTKQCYYVGGAKDVSDRKSFVDAGKACKSIHAKARLASIPAALDQEFVMTLISSLKSSVWIGLKSEDILTGSPDKFYWTDNTVNSDYNNWAPGKPYYARYRDRAIGSCVQMIINPKKAGLWVITDCKQKLPYVCEYRKDKMFAVSNPENWSGRCKSSGYHQFGDSCYKYVATPNKWSASDELCKQDGGHLVTVQNGFDNAYVDIMLQTHNISEIWIGLNMKHINTFRWLTNFPVLYTAWGDLEPRNTSIQACVSQREGNVWGTRPCKTLLPSLCRIYLDGVPTPKPPLVRGICPSNLWTAYGDHCYLLDTEISNTWPEAAHTCAEVGGQLASIHNNEEQAMITSLLEFKEVNAWIGMHQAGDGGYAWLDGTGASYFRWDKGSPIYSNTNTSKQICVLAQGYNGNWTDVSCTAKFNFICKTKQVCKDHITRPCSGNRIRNPQTCFCECLAHCATGTQLNATACTCDHVTELGAESSSHTDKESSGISSGGIAGIVVTVLVITAISIAAVVFVIRRRATSSSSRPQTGVDNLAYNNSKINKNSSSITGSDANVFGGGNP